jgi:hypothetical protein
MKTQAEIEYLCDRLAALNALGDEGPFAPDRRDAVDAVVNVLRYILGDGGRGDRTFRANVERIERWCRDNGVVFIGSGATQ